MRKHKSKQKKWPAPKQKRRWAWVGNVYKQISGPPMPVHHEPAPDPDELLRHELDRAWSSALAGDK